MYIRRAAKGVYDFVTNQVHGFFVTWWKNCTKLLRGRIQAGQTTLHWSNYSLSIWLIVPQLCPLRNDLADPKLGAGLVKPRISRFTNVLKCSLQRRACFFMLFLSNQSMKLRPDYPGFHFAEDKPAVSFLEHVWKD